MPKIKIKSHLKNSTETINKNYFGLIQDNKITYNDNIVTVTLVFEKNKVLLKRSNNEYEINLPLENKINTAGTYLLKNYQKTLSIDIYTEGLIIEEGKIIINYSIVIDNNQKDNYYFEIEYEVISWI